jgi:activator of HSP90 ATPase
VKTRNLQHTVLIRARPKAIYDALMNERKHARFTDAPAKIRAKVGGAFSCYGTYVTGITLELKSNKRIVQAWRSEGWPEGYYSIVTFALSKKSRGATQLHFTQIGIPSGDYAKKNRGWKFHYWEPLKRFLEK